MPAESVLAAHSALPEMSAHPVSKSSFERKTTRSHASSKEALDVSASVTFIRLRKGLTECKPDAVCTACHKCCLSNKVLHLLTPHPNSRSQSHQ